MQFSDVLLDVLLNLLKAFFLKRAYDVLNTYCCDSTEECRRRQTMLLLDNMGVSSGVLNGAFIGLAILFLISHVQIAWSWAPLQNFDAFAVLVALASWLPMLYLPKTRKWIPIEIHRPKIAAQWKLPAWGTLFPAVKKDVV